MGVALKHLQAGMGVIILALSNNQASGTEEEEPTGPGRLLAQAMEALSQNQNELLLTGR